MFYYTNHPTLSLKSEPLIAKLQISLSPTIDWTNLEWHYMWVAVCWLFGCKPWLGMYKSPDNQGIGNQSSKELKCCQNWNDTKREMSPKLKSCKKNPAYGRHWISRRLQIVVPMQNGGKRLKIVREKKRLKMVKKGWKLFCFFKRKKQI